MAQDTRLKRDRYALNEDGMVMCNPRDKESAHRAEMEGIATDDRDAVTCRKGLGCCMPATSLELANDGFAKRAQR